MKDFTTKPKRGGSGRRRSGPSSEGGDRSDVFALATETEDGGYFYATMTDLIIGTIDLCLKEDILSTSRILEEISNQEYFDPLSKRFIKPFIEIDLLTFILENDPYVSRLFYIESGEIHRK